MEKKKTLALVSLGCAKNAVDLQVRAGNMIRAGFSLSEDPDRADVVIVNTCSFIAAAREEAEAEILRALELKRRGRYGRVVVCGCYPQRYPGAVSRFPGVDEWIGVPDRWIEPGVPALRFTGKAFAYLKIAEGCAHRCAYCAIPGIRGKYRSRPAGSILAEAEALIASGCRELNVIAQDPMLYGIDFKGPKRERIGLSDLLWALDDLPGRFWIRVLYSYPSEISGEFLDWMNNSRHAVRYLDVPLQHTVPAVLERMNRAAAVDASLAAADALRELVPGVTLRTTIMTGFPGETEARFRRMLSDLRRMQFDHLGAFAFSPEKGTASYSMPGRPSRATAEARAGEVMALAKKIHQTKARRMLGKECDALVVAPGVARLESQAPDVDGVVYVDGGETGEFVKVKLLKAKGFDFTGETT
jgi:ribosomal protein S12 methylthiotransferase